MENTTLIRVTGIVLVICVISITAILIWYPGTSAEKLLAAGVIAGLITIIGGQFANYKQSGDNAATLAVIAPKVDQAAAQATTAAKESKAAVVAVAENTALTDLTHGLVNGQTKAYKDLIDRFAAMEVRVAKAESLAEGITEGRRQAGDLSAPTGVSAEPQPDGSILVEAPAVIKVVAPGQEPQP